MDFWKELCLNNLKNNFIKVKDRKKLINFVCCYLVMFMVILLIVILCYILLWMFVILEVKDFNFWRSLIYEEV